jgi:hypothetical protein
MADEDHEDKTIKAGIELHSEPLAIDCAMVSKGATQHIANEDLIGYCCEYATSYAVRGCIGEHTPASVLRANTLKCESSVTSLNIDRRIRQSNTVDAELHGRRVTQNRLQLITSVRASGCAQPEWKFNAGPAATYPSRSTDRHEDVRMRRDIGDALDRS